MAWDKRAKNLLAWTLIVAFLLLVVGIAAAFPVLTRFAPPCFVLWLTGWHCPACGISRALVFLVQLHPYAAFRMNPFLVLLLPVVVSWAGVSLWRIRRNKKFYVPPMSLVYLVIGLFFLFGVLRNIQWPLFVWLAPTNLV